MSSVSSSVYVLLLFCLWALVAIFCFVVVAPFDIRHGGRFGFFVLFTFCSHVFDFGVSLHRALTPSVSSIG